MATKPTAEALKEAREKRVTAEANYNKIAEKLGKEDWNEVEDGPALEREKRFYKAALDLVDELTDKLVFEKRKAEQGGGTGDGERAPGVSVNVLQEGRFGDTEAKARAEFRFLRALDCVINKGKFDGIEGEMKTEGEKEMRAIGLDMKGEIQLPSWLMGNGGSTIAEQEAEARYIAKRGLERRDYLAETTTAGGHLIETTVGRLIPVLQPRLQVEAMGATKLVGLTGNLDLPRNNAYGSATWEGEIDDAAETQGTFDKVSLSPERLAAYSQVSRQAILQAKNVDLENFTRRDLNNAVRRKLDYAAINGAGSGDEPTGILNTVGINSITIGTDGGPLDWSLVTLFEREIFSDDADGGMMGYLTTPGVAWHLKNLKRDVAGNGFIWEGKNGDGIINGYTARTSTNVPSTLSKGGSGSILHAMIFANWVELIIAQWGGMDVIVDPYTLKNKGMVEININTYWDIALMHLQSFCECNEIDIS